MAAETVNGIASQVPEYVQYGAWFVITVVGGLALRFGWFTSKDSKPSHEAQFMGGVVDNRGVKALAEAIDDAVEAMKDMHDEKMRRERAVQEVIETLGRDARRLTEQLDKTFERMGKQHGSG